MGSQNLEKLFSLLKFLLCLGRSSPLAQTNKISFTWGSYFDSFSTEVSSFLFFILKSILDGLFSSAVRNCLIYIIFFGGLFQGISEVKVRKTSLLVVSSIYVVSSTEKDGAIWMLPPLINITQFLLMHFLNAPLYLNI